MPAAAQSVGLALYRDGRDSVALHGDRLGALVGNAIVAIVSVGEPRRFLLKARSGGPSITFSPGWGDLLVMGGYTHSRLRQLILGGVTRHMLASADLPVLLNH